VDEGGLRGRKGGRERSRDVVMASDLQASREMLKVVSSSTAEERERRTPDPNVQSPRRSL
jgi:hypothetical protein